MKIKELMERIGTTEVARVAAYIEDAYEELNIDFETHTKVQRMNITKDKRFYNLPQDLVRILEVRVKNHLTSKDEYRRVPRLLNKPYTPDSDNA